MGEEGGLGASHDHEDDHSPGSILFESSNKALVVVDIPASLEEAQYLLPPAPRRRPRIVSAEPPASPYPTPEPRRHASPAVSSAPPAAQVAELMTTATVQAALDELAASYGGPLHLPRPVVVGAAEAEADAKEAADCPPPRCPPRAKPLHGSIGALRDTFDATAPKFRLVVLDPPWPNRSARRRIGAADKYATVSSLDEMRRLLLQIPVAAHLEPDGLVAVWVTNKPSILDFLTGPTGLFAAWGLELATEWTWLKIASSGEPLYDIESTWRKPWEKLIIAKPRGSGRFDGLGPKVIVAVPDVHSRKPNLRGLFTDILGEQYLGLEIFARNLTAGWWSWGDEVMRFQQPEHWEVTVET